jgi:hypothetical protein
VFGLVTRHADELGAEPFDVAVFAAKRTSGGADEPVAGAVTAIAGFADATAADDPELAAVARDGAPATPDSVAGGHVCPTYPGYREGLLATVDEAVEASPDLRLHHAGFPAADYCHCDRCNRAYAASEHDDRMDWRTATVTDLVSQVRERVPGTFSLGVHPDPSPSRLRERTGVDLDAVAPLVDRIVLPLYDDHYATTYWIEGIAGAVRAALPQAVDLGVDLFAQGPTVDALDDAVAAAEPHADLICFAHDAASGRAVLRRRRAASSTGASHRPASSPDDSHGTPPPD